MYQQHPTLHHNSSIVALGDTPYMKQTSWSMYKNEITTTTAIHRLHTEPALCSEKDPAEPTYFSAMKSLFMIPYLLRVPRVLDYPSTQRLDFVKVCQLSQALRFDYLHRSAGVVLLRATQANPATFGQ